MENISQNHQVPKEKELDYFIIVQLLRMRWYIFALAIFASMAVAYMYLRYSTPVYSVSARVFIKDESNGALGGKKFLEGMELTDSYSNLQNEMIFLTSGTVVQKTLDNLNFDYSYFSVGSIKDAEMYKSSFFKIQPDSLTPQLVNAFIYIIPQTDSTFRLKVKLENTLWYDLTNDSLYQNSKPIYVDTIYTYNKTIHIEDSKFVVKSTYNKPQFGKEYYFFLSDKYSLLRQWKNAAIVSLINKDASIVQIESQGTNPQKSVDFINMLSRVYVQKGLDEKNQIALNTINFIDLQLGIIKDSLNVVENDLLSFRKKNKVMNISYEAELDYTKLKDLETERATLQIRQKYFEYLMDYVFSVKDYSALVVPSILDIDDQTLNKLIGELVSLVNEREALMKNNPSTKNPFLQNIDSKIKITKDALYENLVSLNKTSNITLRELTKNIDRLQAGLNKLPATERDFLNIERKFNVNDGIYNYLLEKREEASIAHATNKPDNSIIDSATIYDAMQIAPKGRMVYALAMVIGFFIPMIILLILHFFDNKIYTKEDIVIQTEVPFLGSIVHNNTGTEKMVFEKAKSSVAESFRSIKINLEFLNNKPSASYVIGVTSSFSGEGKTFVALNLAAIYAIGGKKVVLVSMDLRKPGIDKQLFKDKEAGLSNYLAGKVTLDKIIHKTDQHENLSFIPAGIIPPNPAELLSGNKMKELVAVLRTQFDIIILDNSPVGLVVDYMNIIKEVDTTVFIVRQGLTPKMSLDIINDIYYRENIKNVGVVLNDSKAVFQKYSYYGAYYYYGSNANYFEEEKPSFMKWIKSKVSKS